MDGAPFKSYTEVKMKTVTQEWTNSLFFVGITMAGLFLALTANAGF